MVKQKGTKLEQPALAYPRHALMALYSNIISLVSAK